MSMRPDNRYLALLATYHNWPPSSCQQPEGLARAGFSYEGVDDRVRCDICKIRLFDWINCDPLKQHAKFSRGRCELCRELQQHQRDTEDNRLAQPTPSSRREESSHKNFPNASKGLGGMTQADNGKNALYTEECVDVEPMSPISQRSTLKLTAAGRTIKQTDSRGDGTLPTTRRWAPGLDSAYLDRPEMQLLLKHGADKQKLMLVVRQRLSQGLDVLSEPATVWREVFCIE